MVGTVFVCLAYTKGTTCIYSLPRGSLEQTQVQIPPKSNLVNQYVYWGYLPEYRGGVTHRSRNDSYVTKVHPSSQTGNLEHTAQPVGSSTGWKVSFPAASVALNLFLPGSSICLRVSPSILCSLLLGREVPSESGQFQELPEAILSFYLLA